MLAQLTLPQQCSPFLLPLPNGWSHYTRLYYVMRSSSVNSNFIPYSSSEPCTWFHSIYYVYYLFGRPAQRDSSNHLLHSGNNRKEEATPASSFIGGFCAWPLGVFDSSSEIHKESGKILCLGDNTKESKKMGFPLAAYLNRKNIYIYGRKQRDFVGLREQYLIWP